MGHTKSADDLHLWATRELNTVSGSDTTHLPSVFKVDVQRTPSPACQPEIEPPAIEEQAISCVSFTLVRA